jgi:hypothetical protein
MSITIPPETYQSLKNQGYSDVDINIAIQEMENQELGQSYNISQNQRNIDPRNNSRVSAFATKPDDNFARWQLELNDILERAEHILKGDVPVYRDGHILWEDNKFPQDNTLNQHGVNEIMKILSMYVNRNTILSDYTPEEIHIVMYDVGCNINDLLFMKDIEFGIDSDEKKKGVPMLFREMHDIILSAYKRALYGAEKKSLREIISISQNTQLGSNGQIQQGMNQNGNQNRERGLLNPMRYVKGKYV